MTRSRLGALLSLARWLGPWAGESSRPDGVTRETVEVTGGRPGEQPFEAWLYRPASGKPRGAWLVAPGLHFAGPADPRMDRFFTVLAAAGHIVLAPFLPDFAALRVTPRAVRDFERTLEHLEGCGALPEGICPSVFSISFGSLPALRLAASPATAERLGGLVVFGGYADFDATLRFCLTGQTPSGRQPTRDPLNQPVIFLNLLERLPEVGSDGELLASAWRRYVTTTWGRPEMKAPERFHAVAHDVATELPARARELFLVGCGVVPGAEELCERALAREGASHAFLDPRPHLEGVRCPVDIVHGVDDDVIPHEQAQVLADALPSSLDARVHLTGMYGHSRRSKLAAGALARELTTMGNVLGVLTRTYRRTR